MKTYAETKVAKLAKEALANANSPLAKENLREGQSQVESIQQLNVQANERCRAQEQSLEQKQ